MGGQNPELDYSAIRQDTGLAPPDRGEFDFAFVTSYCHFSDCVGRIFADGL